MTTWVAIGLLVVIGLSIAGYINLSNLTGSVSNVTTKGSTAGGFVSVTKPIQITCFDALAGSNCGAVTVALYQGSSSLQLESITASASGVATTGNSYTTGAGLTIKVSGNSKATEFLPFTVPGMDPNSAVSSTNNVVAVYAVTLGAWTQVLTGTGGTTFTSGTTPVSLAKFNGNTVTITDTISETSSNAGYKTSYDVTNLVWQNFIVQVDDGAGASSSTQFASVTGFPHSVKSGSTTYYFVICPDGLSGSGTLSSGAFKVASGSQSAGTADASCAGALSAQTIGTVNYGATAGFSVTIAVGSLTGTNQETFQWKTYAYGDINYFIANSNLGPNNSQQGSTFKTVFSA